MRGIILGLVVYAGMSAAHADAVITAGQESPAMFTEFEATYQLSRGSLKAARSKHSLSKTDSHAYTYRTVTEASGIVALFRDDKITEISSFTIQKNGLRPLAYDYQHKGTKKDRHQSIKYDWQTNTAVNDNRGKISEHPLTADIFDRGSLPWAIAGDLANGQPEDEYQLLDHGKIRVYKMRRTEDVKIKTAAGEFETILVERLAERKADKVARFWFAPELGYLPVRTQYEEPSGDRTSLELVKYTFKE